MVQQLAPVVDRVEPAALIEPVHPVAGIGSGIETITRIGRVESVAGSGPVVQPVPWISRGVATAARVRRIEAVAHTGGGIRTIARIRRRILTATRISRRVRLSRIIRDGAGMPRIVAAWSSGRATRRTSVGPDCCAVRIGDGRVGLAQGFRPWRNSGCILRGGAFRSAVARIAGPVDRLRVSHDSEPDHGRREARQNERPGRMATAGMCGPATVHES